MVFENIISYFLCHLKRRFAKKNKIICPNLCKILFVKFQCSKNYFYFLLRLGAWPWLAALGYSSRHSGFWNMTNVKWLCGGSLISRQHVLTAAHCVFGRPDLHIIRLGGHELTNSDIGNDHFQQVDIGIERKVSHPEYNVKTFENDIAVVTLEREIEFTGNNCNF